MRPSMLVPLFLLLSLLISGTQGIRLQKGPLGHQKCSQKFHELKNDFQKVVNDEDTTAAINANTLCGSGQCSGKGRKLMMVSKSPSPSTAATTTPHHKNVDGRESNPHPTSMPESRGGRGGEDNKVSGDAWVTAEHPEAAPDIYSDAMHISEMDYAPAKKKPPIHN